VLALFWPGGLEGALRGTSAPARSLDLPTGVATCSTADAERIAQRFGQFGVRFLSPDAVADQLPLYPKPVPADSRR